MHPARSPVFEQQWPADARPRVSVLVTTYNQERWIGACLSGILRQVTDFPLELIVVDDASTDRTASIVRQYADKYPHIVEPMLLTENLHSRGLTVRPELHRRARGEFIACCDGDDYWSDQHKLHKQVGFLAANPRYVLSFHDAVHVDLEGKSLGRTELPARARRDYTQDELRVLRWGWMLLGTMVHRNLPFEFPPEYRLIPNADNFIAMLLGGFGGAKFQGEVGPLAYRQHGEGIWSGRTPQERERMQLQSFLQIAAYFVRIGELDAARGIVSTRLAPRIDRLMKP